MFVQRPNPYPTNTDWWRQEMFLGVSRTAFAFLLFWLIISVLAGVADWDHILGRHNHVAVEKMVIRK